MLLITTTDLGATDIRQSWWCFLNPTLKPLAPSDVYLISSICHEFYQAFPTDSSTAIDTTRLGTVLQSTQQGLGTVLQSTQQGLGTVLQSTQQGLGTVLQSTQQGLGTVLQSTQQGLGTVLQSTVWVQGWTFF